MRFALLLLIAMPALAWEPAGPAEVQARITELDKAWAGKTPEQVAQDKVKRSRQDKPAWVSKTTWKMEVGTLTWYFAVGKAGFGPGRGVPASPPTQGRALDWWYDADGGIFYTLVVDAR